MQDRKFPRTECEIYSLAQTMMGGYIANPAVFPHADPVSLQNLSANYQSALQAQVAAKAALLAATTLKEKQLAALQDKMKSQLKMSEVDCRSNPVNLHLIGWRARKTAGKSVLPGQPLELHSVTEGFGTITLDWLAPPDGGLVRTYLVYRRDITLDGELLHDWTLVAQSFKTAVALTKQPRGVQLHYRVTAVNPAGESMQSNNAEVVL